MSPYAMLELDRDHPAEELGRVLIVRVFTNEAQASRSDDHESPRDSRLRRHTAASLRADDIVPRRFPGERADTNEIKHFRTREDARPIIVASQALRPRPGGPRLEVNMSSAEEGSVPSPPAQPLSDQPPSSAEEGSAPSPPAQPLSGQAPSSAEEGSVPSPPAQPPPDQSTHPNWTRFDGSWWYTDPDDSTVPPKWQRLAPNTATLPLRPPHLARLEQLSQWLDSSGPLPPLIIGATAVLIALAIVVTVGPSNPAAVLAPIVTAIGAFAGHAAGHAAATRK